MSDLTPSATACCVGSFLTPRKEYENYIQTHPNFGFLPNEQKKNWVSVSKNGTNPREEPWEKELNLRKKNGELPDTASKTNLARFLHPTKIHICKMCCTGASIYYVYPTKNTQNWLMKTFDIICDNKTETIFEIYAKIEDVNKSENFESYFGSKIELLENECMNDLYNGKKLSPGVMANPPDRLDGFHCYNSICGCRKKNDKGRSDENMKTYSRDRRCYELYSDGNKLLANVIMGKLNTVEEICFICKKTAFMTADHIGPISLGFQHDPTNFQACCSHCNSSKNNRITEEDVVKLTGLENTGNNIISWWAKDCWDKYKNESVQIVKKKMDENVKKFLEIMDWLKDNKTDIFSTCISVLYDFDDKSYIIHDLSVDNSTGNIIYNFSAKNSNKKTKSIQQKRTTEILNEKSKKTNRKIKIELLESDIIILHSVTSDNFKNIVCKILPEV